jgi:O-antigen/teichoic acid export membrane protein
MQKIQVTSQSAKALMVRICGLGLLYLATAAAANYLGAQYFGVFSSVLSLSPILAAMAVGGVDVFAAKTLATIIDGNPCKIAREVALTHVNGLLGATFGLVIIFIIVVAAISLNVDEKNYSVLLHAMYIFPVYLFIYIRQYITISLSNTANAMFPEQVILPSIFIASLLVTDFFMNDFDTSLVLRNYFMAAVLSWIIGLFMVRKQSHIVQSLTTPINASDIINRFKCGRPFLLATVSSVMMANSVTVLVSLFFGFKAAGLYFAAWRLAHLPSMPLQVIEYVIMPTAARFHSLEDHEGLSNLARFGATLSCAAGIAIGIVLISFHGQILGFFGEEFVSAAPAFLILSIGQMLSTVTGPKQSLMRMTGLEKQFSRSFATAAILLPGSVLLAARLDGIVSVSICVSAIIVALDLAFCFFLWKKRNIVPLPYGPRFLLALFEKSGLRRSSFHEKIRLIRQMLSY